MKLTERQSSWLDNRKEAGRKNILEGNSTFRMRNADCVAYFKVHNETVHKPVCRVLKTLDSQALVKAEFIGSGLLTTPVRVGLVPLYVIQYEHSFMLVVCMTFWAYFSNILKRNSHER